MAEKSWYDAVIHVLRERGSAMHYADIAEQIEAQGLRENLGATPATSVNVAISNSFKQEKKRSPFVRIARGIYSLKEHADKVETEENKLSEPEAEAGFINALGMYWSRSEVLWSATSPRILGQQQTGSTEVDFYDQRGVYLLYDRRDVIYVGRAIDQPLGARLKQHTIDRLNGRWDRFSWFGIRTVGENGTLRSPSGDRYGADMLIATMEAVLIEGLEPRQNRKRGDDFRAVEFLQVLDAELQRKRDVHEAVDRAVSRR